MRIMVSCWKRAEGTALLVLLDFEVLQGDQQKPDRGSDKTERQLERQGT